jgi:putative membrane protein
MKPNKLFKTLPFQVLITIAVLIAGSCETKTTEQSSDPAKQATEENDIKFENKKLEKDAQFLVDAAAFNLEEIELARLGSQKGTADVKELSGMMLGEHEKALNEIRDFAKAKQVTVPDSASNDAGDNYNMLKEKTGNEFDKAFCQRLVDTHQKAVEFFEKESSDSRDQDLKEYATTKLPDLRKHLDHIFACQKKVENRAENKVQNK